MYIIKETSQIICNTDKRCLINWQEKAKKAKDLNRQVREVQIQIANRHEKILKLTNSEENKVKVMYYFILTILNNIKKNFSIYNSYTANEFMWSTTIFYVRWSGKFIKIRNFISLDLEMYHQVIYATHTHTHKHVRTHVQGYFL